MCELHKDQIQALLLREDDIGMHAVGRALLVLLANQTEDEKASASVRHDNGKGFRPSHAVMGTSMAQYYEKHKRLSRKQLDYWQQPARSGKHQIRIIMYWRQLIEAAKEKQRLKEEAAQAALNV